MTITSSAINLQPNTAARSAHQSNGSMIRRFCGRRLLCSPMLKGRFLFRCARAFDAVVRRHELQGDQDNPRPAISLRAAQLARREAGTVAIPLPGAARPTGAPPTERCARQARGSGERQPGAAGRASDAGGRALRRASRARAARIHARSRKRKSRPWAARESRRARRSRWPWPSSTR
jgi:hypothetical protein